MDSDQTNRRTAKPACITFLVLFVGIPVLVIAAVFFWYTNRQSQAKSELKQEIAGLRTSGLPIDNATLGEYYESLTDRERTEQWLHIFEQLESPEFTESAQKMPILGEGGTEEVPLVGEPWDEQEEVEAFLQSQQSLLADLHDAASEPGAVWFPTEFDSLDTLIPHAQTARTAARLLQLEHDAAVYAREGERAASLSGIASKRTLPCCGDSIQQCLLRTGLC